MDIIDDHADIERPGRRICVGKRTPVTSQLIVTMIGVIPASRGRGNAPIGWIDAVTMGRRGRLARGRTWLGHARSVTPVDGEADMLLQSLLCGAFIPLPRPRGRYLEAAGDELEVGGIAGVIVKEAVIGQTIDQVVGNPVLPHLDGVQTNERLIFGPIEKVCGREVARRVRLHDIPPWRLRPVSGDDTTVGASDNDIQELSRGVAAAADDRRLPLRVDAFVGGD